MKVLVLHNDYQQAGGETFSVHAEIAALTGRGHEVQLLEVSNDILSTISRTEALHRMLRPDYSFKLVSDVLREFPADVAHVQNLFPLLGAGAIKALQYYQVPWVRSLRNFRKRCLSANLFRDGQTCTDCGTASGAVRGVARGCYRDSRGQSLVALGYANVEQAAENRYPPKAYVAVSDLVSRELRASLVPRVPVVVKPNAVQHAAKVPTDFERRGILFVGRLENHKGIDIVLHMARAMPDVPFRIVGEGPQSALVRAAVDNSSNIRWDEKVTNTGVLHLMASSQLIVAPSRWMEPFGRVAVEALSVGSIPLVGDVGGMREIVEKIDRSLALSIKDSNGWVQKARQVMALSDREYAKYSASCIDVYKQNYTVAANGRMLEEILHKHAVQHA